MLWHERNNVRVKAHAGRDEHETDRATTAVSSNSDCVFPVLLCTQGSCSMRCQAEQPSLPPVHQVPSPRLTTGGELALLQLALHLSGCSRHQALDAADCRLSLRALA